MHTHSVPLDTLGTWLSSHLRLRIGKYKDYAPDTRKLTVATSIFHSLVLFIYGSAHLNNSVAWHQEHSFNSLEEGRRNSSMRYCAIWDLLFIWYCWFEYWWWTNCFEKIRSLWSDSFGRSLRKHEFRRECNSYAHEAPSPTHTNPILSRIPHLRNGVVLLSFEKVELRGEKVVKQQVVKTPAAQHISKSSPTHHTSFSRRSAKVLRKGRLFSISRVFQWNNSPRM